MAANMTMLGFVPDPAGRGTFGILWSCLTVLGLCAWTSLHLDLPSKRQRLFPDKLIPPEEHGLFVKIWWMFIMLLAPETVLTIAINEWCYAYQARKCINQEGEPSVADMWTMNDGFFSNMDGLTRDGRPVNAGNIVRLIRRGTIPPQPSRLKEISDKSKSDALGKALTCAQALWLVIQCLARAIQRLPISTLELGTIGYVFIAVAINALYWHKPKDVLTPLEIISWEARQMFPDGEELHTLDAASARYVAGNEEENPLFSGRKSPARWEAWLDRFTEKDAAAHLGLWMLVLVCALYGGWHCLAWNFAFPSVAEKWLWRVGSILTSFPGLVLVLLEYTDRIPRQIRQSVESILVIAALLLYILSRGFILVEMFIGLRRLPAGVFDTVQWMAFIPHV